MIEGSLFVFQPPMWGARAYDAVNLYAIGLNKTLQAGKNIRDGQAIIDSIRSISFKSEFISFSGDLCK